MCPFVGLHCGCVPPLWKYVCPFVGLHCVCVPPLWKYVCLFVGLHCGCVPPPIWKYVCPFVGLHCGCVPPSCVPFHWILACCLLRFAAFFCSSFECPHGIRHESSFWASLRPVKQLVSITLFIEIFFLGIFPLPTFQRIKQFSQREKLPINIWVKGWDRAGQGAVQPSNKLIFYSWQILLLWHNTTVRDKHCMCVRSPQKD